MGVSKSGTRLLASAVVGFFALSPAIGYGADRLAADFSGRWKMDPARSESAHQAVPVKAITLEITQTAKELIIETTTGSGQNAGQTETLSYKLDGSENTISTGSGESVKTRARWDGARLVTETVRNINGAAVTILHVLSVDAGGKQLTIDRRLTVQHGYQSSSGNNTGSGRDVFVKTRHASPR